MCLSLTGCFWSKSSVKVRDKDSVQIKANEDEKENIYDDYSFDGTEYDDTLEEDELDEL